MFHTCDGKPHKNWKNCTLVIPCISVGNVGQLTADLLISTLWMNKVGYFYDDSVLPAIGNDPFATGDAGKVCRLMTAAEVFEHEHHQLVVVQLRSSIKQNKRQQFVENLQKWIDSCGFHQVALLTSSYSHERRDTQMEGTQFRCIPSSHFRQTDSYSFMKDKLSWVELEPREGLIPQPRLNPASDGIHGNPAFRDGEQGGGAQDPLTEAERGAREECSTVFIPGGGFARRLLEKCISSGVSVVVLLRFCAEGDNIFDALEMATCLNDWHCWLDLKKATQQKLPGYTRGWRIPSSWSLQYGSRFDQILYH